MSSTMVSSKTTSASNKRTISSKRTSISKFCETGLPQLAVLGTAPPGDDAKRRALPLMTREELARRAALGEMLVVIDGTVCDLSSFADHHPGGVSVLNLARGTDVTDAVVAFHPNWAIARMRAFRIAVITDLEPSQHSRQFLQLRRTLEDAGLFRFDVWYYVRLVSMLFVLWVTFVGLIVYGPRSNIVYIISALICSSTWHQASFFAHDAAHSEVTGDAKTDMVISILVANILGGLSVGWWKHNHNVHHLVTNDPINDPDIQHIPFFAITSKFSTNIYSTFYKRVLEFDRAAQFFISVQHLWFYTILAFGRFNLYFLSWSYCLRKERTLHRKQEIICMLIFWAWFLPFLSYLPDYRSRFLFVFVSHTATLILHLQITLSHFAMSTEVPSDTSFAERNIRTTMDVECAPWMDWFHGGLQYQVEHHLFPRLPRRNLRKSRPYVLDFCKQLNLDLARFTFTKSNSVVLGAMQEVAFQIRSILAVDPKFALASSITD